MSFLHSEFLFFMLPPVLFLFYFLLTQKDPVAQLFDSRVYRKLRVNEKRLSLRQRNALYLGIFVLVIVAMAQPVIVEQTLTAATPQRTLLVALDLTVAQEGKAKVSAVLARSEAERIGILAYDQAVYAVSPPTRDRQALRSLVSGIRVNAAHTVSSTLFGVLRVAESLVPSNEIYDLVIISSAVAPETLAQTARALSLPSLRLWLMSPSASTPVVAMQMDAVNAATKTHHGTVKTIKRYGQLFIFPLGLALVLLLIATASLRRDGRTYAPPVVLLGLLLHGGLPLHAGMQSYRLLEAADQWYATGAYDRAARAYDRYSRLEDDNPYARYNSACAQYRAGHYAAAVSLWGSIHVKDRALQFATLFNLGNAHVMQGGVIHLEAALKAYRSALYLENDLQAKENLERARAMLIWLVRFGDTEGAAHSGVALEPTAAAVNRSGTAQTDGAPGQSAGGVQSEDVTRLYKLKIPRDGVKDDASQR